VGFGCGTAFRAWAVGFGCGQRISSAKQRFGLDRSVWEVGTRLRERNSVIGWRTRYLSGELVTQGDPAWGEGIVSDTPLPTYLDTVPLASDKYSISRELPRRRTTGLDGKLGEARSG
jgi:hypothetical protein